MSSARASNLFLPIFLSFLVFFNPFIKQILINELRIGFFLLFAIISLFTAKKAIRFNTLSLLFLALILLSSFVHIIESRGTLFPDMSVFLTAAATLILMAVHKDKFILAMLNVIFYTSIFGLATWLLTLPLYLIGFDLFDLFKSFGITYRDGDGTGRVTMFVINFAEDSIRNRGLWWEPSILAQINFIGLLAHKILSFRNHHVSDNYRNIFIASILSSFSTGGYLLIFLYTIMFVRVIKQRSFNLLLLLVITTFIFFSNSFLFDKTYSQIVSSLDINSYQYYASRFNFLYLIGQLSDNYLFGVGPNYSEQISSFVTSTTWNGYLEFLVSFGLTTFIVLHLLIIRASTNLFSSAFLSKNNVGFFILVILSMNLSNIFTTPLFYFLIFWGLSTKPILNNEN